MLQVFLIRHSKTEGNLLHRYIGRTDEPLCEEGIKLLSTKSYPNADVIFCSPMLRCIETAKILYGEKQRIVIDDLKECDFGDFENKNYKELAGNEDYQKWIDSNGLMPFPNGEDLKDFKERCIKAFRNIINEVMDKEYKAIALVVHGGTIMSIMEKFSNPHKDYYDWQIGNGEFLSVYIEKEEWIEKNEYIRLCKR